MDGALLKRLIRKNKEDVVHSSGFATAQNGNAMGAASTESFQRRREIDRNRTVVRGYGDSKIVTGAMRSVPRVKVKKPLENAERFKRETSVSKAQEARAKRDARFGAGASQSRSQQSTVRKTPGFYR